MITPNVVFMSREILTAFVPWFGPQLESNPRQCWTPIYQAPHGHG